MGGYLASLPARSADVVLASKEGKRGLILPSSGQKGSAFLPLLFPPGSTVTLLLWRRPFPSWCHTRTCLQGSGEVEENQGRDLNWKRRGPKLTWECLSWLAFGTTFRSRFQSSNISFPCARCQRQPSGTGREIKTPLKRRTHEERKSLRLFPDIRPPPSGKFPAHLCTLLPTTRRFKGVGTPFTRPPTFGCGSGA